MAAVSAPATVGSRTRPCNDTEKHALWRAKKNRKRKQARQRFKLEQAKPALLALSKAEFVKLTGCTPEEYDDYAARFIAAAKAARRRWEFPLVVRI